MLLSFSTLLHVDAISCNRILEDARIAPVLTIDYEVEDTTAMSYSYDAGDDASVAELIHQLAALLDERLANALPTYKWDETDYDAPRVDVLVPGDVAVLLAA